MAISVKHKFQSGKGDGPDNTVVQPGDWNDEHNLTLNTSNVVGRVTAGVGAAEEIPAGVYGRSVLACNTSADAGAIGVMPPGAILPFCGAGAMTGWVRANGNTIGNSASAATELKSPTTQALFIQLYNSFSDAICPVTPSGRSGVALNDFNANKAIKLPDFRGRQLTGDDVMGATAANVIPGAGAGDTGGASTHVIAVANLPAAQINVTVDPSGSHAHTYKNTTENNRTVASGSGATIAEAVNPASDNANTSVIANHAHPARTANLGSGTALPTMDPFWVVTFYIKL